ncbi:MAG TPA: hypothetical protein DEP35_03270 [Deltaproteobacteria bacterium]|jgi:hypothetical protein|nr:hypothetical protein [Deltaproteobacteria bacterium]
MEVLLFVRFLSAGAAVFGGLFLAFALVYGRLSAISRRRLYPAPPRPLTPQEFESLRLWQRRTVSAFVLAMGAVMAYGLSFALVRWIPPWVYLAECTALLLLAAGALSIHFSGCCPVCRRRIGFQSTLLLPLACEICGAVFRPLGTIAPVAAALPRNIHMVSRIHIRGWPLFAVAVGRDPVTGRTFGVARAWVAVGDVAVGAVAVGGLAVGAIAVGGVSVGAVGLGGVAIGLAAVGGLAAGPLALGGLALGIQAMGGIAIGPHALGALTVGSTQTPLP